MADDALTAELDRIAAELRTFGANGEDARRLLAAVDEVLKQADKWEATSDSRPLIYRGYAAECFRAAVVRGLTGKGESGG